MITDEDSRPLDPYFNQSQNMTDIVQAHKEGVRSLEFLKSFRGVNQQVISCGKDGFLKIWSFDKKVQLVGSLNVSHPLPIFWNFSVDSKELF